jgi:hypothetical protein
MKGIVEVRPLRTLYLLLVCVLGVIWFGWWVLVILGLAGLDFKMTMTTLYGRRPATLKEVIEQLRKLWKGKTHETGKTPQVSGS